MKISVVVPVYNVERFLPRCVQSLLAQTFTDWEMILVDDGSTDGSGALCDHYAAQPGVRVHHQANAGLGMARNSGLALAQGEYVTFVDSDDYVAPTLLEHLDAAVGEQKADLVIGGFTQVTVSGRQRPILPAQEPRLFAGREQLRSLTLGTLGAPPEAPWDSQYGLSSCGRLYRRQLLEDHRLRFVSERELISEDLIFNLEVLRYARRAALIPEDGYFYCTNPGSLSKRHRPDRFARDCQLYRAVEVWLEEAGFSPEEYGLYLRRMLLSRARFDMAQEVAYRDEAERGYPLRQSLQTILEEPLLRRALEGYPWQRLPRMQGLFTLAMQHRWVEALVWLVRGRQWLRP